MTLSDAAAKARQELEELIQAPGARGVIVLGELGEACRRALEIQAGIWPNFFLVTSQQPNEVKPVIEALPGGEAVIFAPADPTKVISVKGGKVVKAMPTSMANDKDMGEMLGHLASTFAVAEDGP